MENKKIEMSAEFSDTGYMSGEGYYHMRFQFNDVIVDTADTFDGVGWETAVSSKGISWIIIRNGMNFKEALAQHGKIIYEVLKGKRRFKNREGEFETLREE